MADDSHAQVQLGGQAIHHRFQVQVQVGDVHHQGTIILELAQVERDGFFGQKVGGDGVGLEGVDDQQIESILLAGFSLSFQLYPGIAFDYLDFRLAVDQKGEVSVFSFGQPDDRRVDFVKSEQIIGFRQSRGGTHPQADQRYSQGGGAGRMFGQQQAQAGLVAKIRGGD